MNQKIGQSTYRLSTCPSVIAYANAVGKKEGEGPLSQQFDQVFTDTHLGQKTWEKAESELQKAALSKALTKAKLKPEALDLVLAGDLLNQCISSGYAARDLGRPMMGLYGACSTMAEALGLAGMLLDGGFGTTIGVVTSSHFCTAERQYRSPLEYGSQRTPTAQWTATASGSVILGAVGNGPYLTHVTVGTVTDWEIKDANNMGAAMAPAAYRTISTHLSDTGRTQDDYDLIVTGDLGSLGHQLVQALFERDGIALGETYQDCGMMLFDTQQQDVHCGASGCGCSAAVLTGLIFSEMAKGTWNRVLFCGTGALHSPVALGQGESVPGICHAVAISNTRED
jgi:stage V sporulation protein AD